MSIDDQPASPDQEGNDEQSHDAPQDSSDMRSATGRHGDAGRRSDSGSRERRRTGEDRVTYDCTAWAGESRRLFASLLDVRGIADAWQGTEVTVFSADQEVVDGLVDEVLATARSAVNTGAATIVYEVSGWPDALQNEFAAQLTISEVAYDWDVNGDIVVNESDEDSVEEVIDLLPAADSFDNVDGLEVQELLNELFMVSDRLCSKPADDSATQSLLQVTEMLKSVSLPFGFEKRDWDNLISAASQAATTEDAISHKTRARLAKDAREMVRQYI